MIKRIEAKSWGRSYGADYCRYVKKHAENLGLTGIVKKNSDGSVSVTAEGEEDNLIKLSNKMKSGPLLSTIEGCFVSWSNPTGEFKDFLIV